MLLIEIGLTSMIVHNDDHVTVGFYPRHQLIPIWTARAASLPYATYDIDHEKGVPRYGDTRVRKNRRRRVCKTNAADVHLPHYGNYQYLRQLIREMQMDVPLAADSDRTSGMVYGYYGVDQIYSYVRGMLTSFPNRHKFSCPAIYVAAHELADGHPDPESGECTTLSSAFKFEAVRAFINHPAETHREHIGTRHTKTVVIAIP